MPQIDKATFFPIVFWTFLIFSLGYLLMSLSPLFTFVTSHKFLSARAVHIYTMAIVRRRIISVITLFPLISL